MSGHRWAARAASAVAAVALTVTGGTLAQADDDLDSLSAEEIAERSRDALLDVNSLHLSARGSLDGSGPEMRLDLTLDREGNCTGGVDMGDDGSVEIVKRGDDVWLKPDAAFWKEQVPIGGSTFDAILDGRYMKASADDPRLLSVTEVCDLDTFRELITDNAGDRRPGHADQGREDRGERRARRSGDPRRGRRPPDGLRGRRGHAVPGADHRAEQPARRGPWTSPASTGRCPAPLPRRTRRWTSRPCWAAASLPCSAPGGRPGCDGGARRGRTGLLSQPAAGLSRRVSATYSSSEEASPTAQP